MDRYPFASRSSKRLSSAAEPGGAVQGCHRQGDAQRADLSGSASSSLHAQRSRRLCRTAVLYDQRDCETRPWDDETLRMKVWHHYCAYLLPMQSTKAANNTVHQATKRV